MLLFQDTTTAQVVEAVNYSAVVTEMLTAELSWLILLLAYAYSKNRETFNFLIWLKSNINRYIVGTIMTIVLVYLNAISVDTSTLLRLIGLTTEKTTISFGIAIALFLIGGISSKPPENSPNA